MAPKIFYAYLILIKKIAQMYQRLLCVQNHSTHWPLVTPYGNKEKIWVNFGSGNGFLPEGTKPLPISMLTYNDACDLWYLC